MAVHSPSTHEDCLEAEPGLILNNLLERLRLLPNPEPGDRGHPQAAFHHLVSGMDSGYYSYLWYVCQI
jgi:metallopeptidase MepB